MRIHPNSNSILVFNFDEWPEETSFHCFPVCCKENLYYFHIISSTYLPQYRLDNLDNFYKMKVESNFDLVKLKKRAQLAEETIKTVTDSNKQLSRQLENSESRIAELESLLASSKTTNQRLEETVKEINLQ